MRPRKGEMLAHLWARNGANLLPLPHSQVLRVLPLCGRRPGHSVLNLWQAMGLEVRNEVLHRLVDLLRVLLHHYVLVPRRNDVHHPIHDVGTVRHRVADLLAVVQRISHRAIVDRASAISSGVGGQHDQLVEQLSNLNARLMDDDDAGQSDSASQELQNLDACFSVGGTQTRCGFVCKHQLCTCDQAACQSDTSLLAARNATTVGTTHDGVLDMGEPQGGQDQVQLQ
mmetsp:Transcript_76869/g.168009  ORF Transcript_76869/g.168009 Transcript_76869/m.168009 type:complete len:227 (+) Transcript_76869:1234-1914(+)